MATEIEFRGPLTKNKFQKLLSFFEKEAVFVKRMKRKTFVFKNKDKTLDLKVRTTNGVPEIVLKKGFAGAIRREEIILPLKTDSTKDALQLFSLLGHNKGIIAIEVLKLLNLMAWSEKEVYDFMMYCKKNIDEHFEYKNK